MTVARTIWLGGFVCNPLRGQPQSGQYTIIIRTASVQDGFRLMNLGQTNDLHFINRLVPDD